MAIMPVPTLTDIPPFPELADRAAGSYNAKAYAFGAHMGDKFNGEIVAVAANVRNNALEAQQSAQSAETSAASTAANAANAARDAATAASAPGTNATSATSMAIGLGTKTFTLAQTGKLFGRSNTITISAPTGDNWMSGPITAFNSATGEMAVNVTNISGSGTFAAWTVSLSGAAGLTGVVNELLASSIASAATTNLTNASGNLMHITGASTINAFILTPGAERSVIFDGALTLTNSPGLLLPGGSNIITAAGDRALIRGDSNGSILTHYQRASGLPVVGGVISKEYRSPDQVFAVSTTITMSHGLGVVPKLVMAFVRCVAASNGFQVGDIAPVPMDIWQGDGGNGTKGCRLIMSQTTITVTFAGGSSAGTGDGEPFRNISRANFNFFIEAFA